jgi:hypothetical protein
MMEGGALVGRRAVCRSFPKKKWNKKLSPPKKTELRNKE